jgi:hypothetical protein
LGGYLCLTQFFNFTNLLFLTKVEFGIGKYTKKHVEFTFESGKNIEILVSYKVCKFMVFLGHLGFITGILWVGFSDTIPEPMNTIPIQPWVQYLRVMGTALCETRSFLVPFNITIYSRKKL